MSTRPDPANRSHLDLVSHRAAARMSGLGRRWRVCTRSLAIIGVVLMSITPLTTDILPSSRAAQEPAPGVGVTMLNPGPYLAVWDTSMWLASAPPDAGSNSALRLVGNDGTIVSLQPVAGTPGECIDAYLDELLADPAVESLRRTYEDGRTVDSATSLFVFTDVATDDAGTTRIASVHCGRDWAPDSSDTTLRRVRIFDAAGETEPEPYEPPSPGYEIVPIGIMPPTWGELTFGPEETWLPEQGWEQVGIRMTDFAFNNAPSVAIDVLLTRHQDISTPTSDGSRSVTLDITFTHFLPQEGADPPAVILDPGQFVIQDDIGTIYAPIATRWDDAPGDPAERQQRLGPGETAQLTSTYAMPRDRVHTGVICRCHQPVDDDEAFAGFQRISTRLGQLMPPFAGTIVFPHEGGDTLFVAFTSSGDQARVIDPAKLTFYSDVLSLSDDRVPHESAFVPWLEHRWLLPDGETSEGPLTLEPGQGAVAEFTFGPESPTNGGYLLYADEDRLFYVDGYDLAETGAGVAAPVVIDME